MKLLPALLQKRTVAFQKYLLGQHSTVEIVIEQNQFAKLNTRTSEA
ncbi:Uncharacterised protein [Legionella sainthelensi]|nr:Uncharacterised protein [Legionella sainthelensi]